MPSRAGPCLPLAVTLVGAAAAEVLCLLLRAEAPPALPLALHLAALLFLLANVLGNMVLFVSANPSVRGVLLAGAVGQGWEYCYSCQTHVPPRCHHCATCNVCVLRRDHHCALLGQCVGHRNYRYFLGLLLHGWAALLYASLLNAEVFAALLREGVTLHGVLLLFTPWLMLLTGQVSPSTFIYTFVADSCVVSFLFCSAFLLFHVLLSLRGQTTREWFGENRCYDLGWRRNLQEALGDRSPSRWCCRQSWLWICLSIEGEYYWGAVSCCALWGYQHPHLTCILPMPAGRSRALSAPDSAVVRTVGPDPN